MLKLALRHYRCGEHARAAAVLEGMLDADRNDKHALLLLGLIRDAQDDVAEGSSLLARYLSLQQDDGFAWHRLGRMRQALGDDPEACRCFTRAAMLRPTDAPGLNDLGAAHYRLGRPELAVRPFEQAVALDPGNITALANLARLYESLRRPEAADATLRLVLAATPRDAADRLEQAAASLRLELLEQAEAACRAALAADPVGAGLLLAETLERRERREEAAAVRDAVGRSQGIVHHACLGRPEASVLLIGGAGLCNLPTDFLIDRNRFDVSIVQVARSGTDIAGLLAALPPIDVAFNVAGDADTAAAFLPTIEALGAALGRRLLNPPSQIGPTRRDRLAATLQGIPGLEVPNTVRCATLEEGREPPAMRYPLLVRPAGMHGGHGLVRVVDDDERDGAMAKSAAEACYVSEFIDTRSPDGWFRKYRLAFVGNEVFPVHLAICKDWLAHYWRADMVDWMQEEETAFLSDYRSVFPGDTLRLAAERLGLDFGGMDCAKLADGRVLVFEANATMLVHMNGASSPKRREALRVRDAMSRLLLEPADHRDRAATRQ